MKAKKKLRIEKKRLNRIPSPTTNAISSKILIMSLLGYNRFDTLKQELDLTDRNLHYHLERLENAKLILNIPNPDNQRVKYYTPFFLTLYHVALLLQFRFGFQWDWFPQEFAESKELIGKTLKQINPNDIRNLYLLKRRLMPNIEKGQKKLGEELDAFAMKRQNGNTTIIGNEIEAKTPRVICDTITICLKNLKSIPEKQKKALIETIDNTNTFLISVLAAIYLSKNKLIESAAVEDKADLIKYFGQLEERKLDNANVQLVSLGLALRKNQTDSVFEVIQGLKLKKEFEQSEDYLKEMLGQIERNPMEAIQ